MTANQKLPDNNKLAARLAYVITAAWAISFVVDILVGRYDPPASVHALMMLVAGGVFGEGLIKSRNGTSQQPKEPKSE